MSAISEIVDSIDTTLRTLYPVGTARPLTDPYNIDLNDDITLKRGYGFYMGGGSDRGNMGIDLAVERELVVTLTIETGSSEHKIEKRLAAEKTLLEDHFKLISLLQLDPALNEKVSGIIYQNDNGLEFIFGEEKTNFLMIQSRFTVIYVERLGV